MLLFPTAAVHAETQTKNYPLGRQINLHGVFSSDTMYFTKEDYWDIKSAQLTLIFTQSDLLSDLDISTLTVYLNDNPVSSINLKDKTKYKESITIKLHPEDIKPGVNEIRIEPYRRLSSKPCTDDVNNANWITFYEESFVHLEFEEKKPENIIGDFPYPFIKTTDSNSGAGSILMLPDNFNNEELESALILSSNFGERQSQQDTSVTLTKYSDADMKKSSDIIYIGTTEDTPKEILSLFSTKELESAKISGILKIAASPYNSNKKILCILSKTGNGLFDKAARLLSNDDLVSQIMGSSYVMNSNLDVDTKAAAYDDHMTMESLGYNGILLKGPFRQETSIGVKLPQNRVLQTGGKVVINMRYSQNLDFDKSLLTVYINGVPIGSKKLELKAADGDKVEINIPNDVKKGSYYEIKIAFDLELPGSFCTFRQEEMPWAYVDKDSYLYIPTSEKNQFLFENYPSPIIKDWKWNDVTMVIPDEPTSSDLNMAANITEFMGRETKSNKGSISVVKSSEFSEKDKNKNLIIIGTPNNNKLIKQINGSLWFQYNSDFTAFASNEKRELIDSYSEQLSSIQLITSPFNKDFSAIVLTAPNAANLNKASKYLTQSSLESKLNGDCSLIDTSDNVSNYYFKIYNESSKNVIKNIASLDSRVVIFAVFFLAALALIILAMVLYIRANKKSS